MTASGLRSARESDCSATWKRATVFATFALGTALGDFTASSLNMGYLPSGLFFFGLILIPALAWWRLHLNSIVAFWSAYIVTRPLGASFSDWISKPSHITGIDFGDGRAAVVFVVAVLTLVTYLAVAKPDIQDPGEALSFDTPQRRAAMRPRS